MRMLPVLALTAVLVPTLVFAQSASQAPPPHKVSTPEQVAYRQAREDYDAHIDKLRATALGALSAETSREKIPACPNASSTPEINQCLAHEGEITGANYKTFARAIRAMLAYPVPQMPGLPYPMMGPSGPEATPATDTAAFDKAEAAWQAYAKSECNDAVDTHWRGGTIVNSMDEECDLRLARARMHELDEVYSITHPM